MGSSPSFIWAGEPRLVGLLRHERHRADDLKADRPVFAHTEKSGLTGHANIVDVPETCQVTLMKGTPEQIASDWIVYTQLGSSKAPDDVYERGWIIYDASYDQPALAWEAIKAVVSRYSEEELFTERETEAKRILANTAAGPLESLLAEHGTDFIESVEVEARRDRRMLWTVGCVWQNSMSEDIWTRVQRAAGGVSR